MAGVSCRNSGRLQTNSILRFNFKGIKSFYGNLFSTDLDNMGLGSLAYEKVAPP